MGFKVKKSWLDKLKAWLRKWLDEKADKAKTEKTKRETKATTPNMEAPKPK